MNKDKLCDCVLAITQQNHVALEYMLNQYGYPNESYQHGHTLLTHAACFSSKQIVQLLIEHGANIDEMDQDGDWALQCAIWSENADVVKYLLQAGANPDLFNDAGVSCESVAQDRFPAALAWLEEARASLDAKRLHTTTPAVKSGKTNRL